jgi:hypothetical protein
MLEGSSDVEFAIRRLIQTRGNKLTLTYVADTRFAVKTKKGRRRKKEKKRPRGDTSQEGRVIVGRGFV